MVKKTLLALAAVFALAFSLAACGQSGSLSCESIDQTSMSVTFDNADEDYYTVSGTLTVTEDDKVAIFPYFENDGSMTIQFIPAFDDPNANIGDLEEAVDPSTAVDEAEVSGDGRVDCYLPAGDYYVAVTPHGMATGSVQITTLVDDGSDMWRSASTAEEAATAANIDSFEVAPTADLTLGPLMGMRYSFTDFAVKAQASAGAVDLTFVKGLTEVTGDDCSLDGTEYANQWTQDIDGTQVTCFGNRDGEATKTIWTSGDYSYALLAYGAGGDADFGLGVQDLTALVTGLK